MKNTAGSPPAACAEILSHDKIGFISPLNLQREHCPQKNFPCGPVTYLLILHSFSFVIFCFLFLHTSDRHSLHDLSG